MNTIKNEDISVGVWPPVVRTGMSTHLPGSGVYVLHLPTGLGTISTSERSQFANKNNAIKALNKLLEEL